MFSQCDDRRDCFWAILLRSTGGSLNLCQHSDISILTFSEELQNCSPVSASASPQDLRLKKYSVLAVELLICIAQSHLNSETLLGVYS
jgi:hypothetical protein